MRMCIVGTAVVAMLGFAGTTQAAPIGAQQPYFTYSPGAVDFEEIAWTPLDYAAFTAYGGYFANVRQPRVDTPLPQLFFQNADFGIEDEVNVQANVFKSPTFVPAFALASVTTQDEAEADATSVPEPGTLALVGIGLLAGSRSLRRRLTR